MYVVTTPSKKNFDYEHKSVSLPLPEVLAAKMSQLLKCDIVLTHVTEEKMDVVSDKAFGYNPVEKMWYVYWGTCTVTTGTNVKRGRIRFNVRKEKYLGHKERW